MKNIFGILTEGNDRVITVLQQVVQLTQWKGGV